MSTSATKEATRSKMSTSLSHTLLVYNTLKHTHTLYTQYTQYTHSNQTHTYIHTMHKQHTQYTHNKLTGGAHGEALLLHALHDQRVLLRRERTCGSSEVDSGGWVCMCVYGSVIRCAGKGCALLCTRLAEAWTQRAQVKAIDTFEM